MVNKFVLLLFPLSQFQLIPITYYKSRALKVDLPWRPGLHILWVEHGGEDK
ncbi:hypothetical protein X474_05280 [Dethiosulfatarculus sandiegensis]|uniref:Uncharacterized protein n=1 Tax=Dethiosulfatarculus sandiegensis TaxID=1429043 RepID=A0A0D2GKD9_9BACT|nr:hypothetical protein X474_05280 [Dethiosulfatarculus sandiegensis]